ncbi:MAG: acyl carrier protein phosphodiesterase [Weeksellaceae bacterium]|jgi:acyl carrier protein phosphodiesterase|nr:acyl carrier protein phosphodiesterase [Weeksellaceae bacterium]
MEVLKNTITEIKLSLKVHFILKDKLEINLKLPKLMNFLAHQYLSFQNSDIQLGNLYGEIVRAKDYINYPNGIQTGILLHRSIDHFTDEHAAVKNCTKFFHENHGKYAPVIVDVVFDYFLIKNWTLYSSIEFEKFVEDCYRLFQLNLNNFPPSLRYIVKHLLKYDWFHNYQSLKGIQQTLKGISQRSKFENNIEDAIIEIQEFHDPLESNFRQFFPEIIIHSQKFIKDASLNF